MFSYGTNGASWDYESGYCSRRKGAIEYRPNVAPERQHPDDGYIILMGEDLEEYTLQGYQDGGCDPGEELDDLGCTITRYESTLGEVLADLMPEYLGEMIDQLDAERFGVKPPEGILHFSYQHGGIVCINITIIPNLTESTGIQMGT